MAKSNLTVAKEILVVGGNGFIGSKIVEILHKHHFNVTILSRNVMGSLKDIKLVNADITNQESLEQIDDRFDTIINTSVGTGEPEYAWNVNVNGPLNLLRNCSKWDVKRYIHLSSAAVYGRKQLPDIVYEDHPLVKSGGGYEMSKAEGERVLKNYCLNNHIGYVIIRPPIVYGPNSTSWIVEPFLRVKYESIRLIEGGSSIINLLHVNDLANSILQVVSNTSIVNESFNINSSERITWLKYLGSFCSALKKPLPRSCSIWRANMAGRISQQTFRFTRRKPIISTYDVELMSNHSYFSSEKARRMLGFENRIDFESGIRDAIEWLRSNQFLS
jgi:nucleoside-diphosphate-sugar epimerase